jgi:hypothetical protein
MSVLARRAVMVMFAAGLLSGAHTLWAADNRGAREAFEPGSFAEPDVSTLSVPRHHGSKIELVWIDPLGRLPCAFDDLTREVAALFDGLGVTLQWHTATAGMPTDAGELHVILLDDARVGGNAARAMGVTQSSPGSARALWVVLPNIRRTLGLPEVVRGHYSKEERWMLARAMARVVAHEIVHSVVPLLPHASSGLMRKQLDRGALLDDKLSLDPASLRAFRASVAARLEGADVDTLPTGQRPADGDVASREHGGAREPFGLRPES